MTTETPETTPVAAPAAIPAAPAVAGGPAWAVGRRKAATARVRLAPGSGKVKVNGRALDVHFTDMRDRTMAVRPLEALGAMSRYDVTVNVRGGGSTGQAGAILLAVARALGECEPNLKPALRQGEFVTRDARVKERKKYGRRGARRGFQFSKR